ncbi:MAG: flagellar biosynthesis protein FlhB [Cycloclasticus sp.]|jgi:flagellar biosynthetic protein FlhB
MADQEQNKSEQATEFKLEEAKKKGQVPKSMDTNSWVVVLAAFLVLLAFGMSMVNSLIYVMRFLFSQSASIDVTVDTASKLIGDSIAYGMATIWPLWLALIVFSVAVILFQTGPVFSFFPVKPDFNRINPIAGFKRLFSIKMLFEALKTFFKLIILMLVIWFCIIKTVPDAVLMYGMSPVQVINYLIAESQFLIICLLVSFSFIVLFDFVFSRRDFAKQMRMSKREVKDETKRRDGDPLVKSKRRQLQQELSAQLGSLGNLPKANVVITNPTHISVALQYDPNTMAAPAVVAKGSGEYALRIRELARDNRIQIIENKPLARKLYRKVRVNDGIPPELFPLVAQIYINLKNSN